MNSHRFARTGRCRFIICCGMLILIIGMVAIFHSTQLQLDESRQQRLLCEQQQEALNERLTSLVEQKFHMEKHHERERNEELESKRNSEQTIKELEEKLAKDILHYNELEENHKQLQNDHDILKAECVKLRQQYNDEKHKLEENLQHITMELKHARDVQLEETNMWKTKYNSMMHEKAELEASINKQEVEKLRAEIKSLEMELQKYNIGGGDRHNGNVDNNNGQTAVELQQNNVMNKQFNTAMDKPNRNSNNSDINNNSNNNMNIKTNQNELVSWKNFNKQEPIGDGVYHIIFNITEKSLYTQQTNQTNTTNMNLNGNSNNNNYNSSKNNSNNDTGKMNNNNDDDQLKIPTTPTIITVPFMEKVALKQDNLNNPNNHSLILNSVENFQIVPKLIKSQEYNINNKNNKMLQLQPVAVTPLEAPKNINGQQQMALPSSSPVTRSEQQVPIAIMLAKDANSSSSTTPHKHLNDGQQQQSPKNNDGISSSSSSTRPPLVMPPKKLPENVAPIPDSFDTFFDKVHEGNNMQQEHQHQKLQPEQQQQQQQQQKHEEQSIIFDVKKLMEPKLQALKSGNANNGNNNYDDLAAGPHNQNIHPRINNENIFLLQHNDENNFFNSAKDQLKLDTKNKLINVAAIDDDGHHVHDKLKPHNKNGDDANDENDDDDDNDSEIGLVGGGGLGIKIGDGGGGHGDGDHDNDAAIAGLGGGAAGDIIVQEISNNKQQQQQQQQQQHLLDSNNLNNEVAADQGKEFGDGGLRIDEGDADDADDDDYLNPGERLQGGGKAIRN